MGRRGQPGDLRAILGALSAAERAAFLTLARRVGVPLGCWPSIDPLRQLLELAAWVSRVEMLVASGRFTRERAILAAAEELGVSSDALTRRLGRWLAVARMSDNSAGLS